MSRLWHRWQSDKVRWTLFAIAVGTFFSGLLLVVASHFVLNLFSAPTTTSDRLFFAIIGMFMAVVGGMLSQTLLLAKPDPVIVGWAAVQKLGASAAMSLGVAISVLSYWGIILAAFDFCSAWIAIIYLARLSRQS